MENFSPEILLLPFIVSAAILYYYVYMSNIRQKSRSLPSPPNKLPIIGHFHFFMKDRQPHKSFVRLAEKLGPIYYVQLGRVATVVVTSNDLAKQVLKTHDQVHIGRPR